MSHSKGRSACDVVRAKDEIGQDLENLISTFASRLIAIAKMLFLEATFDAGYVSTKIWDFYLIWEVVRLTATREATFIYIFYSRYQVPFYLCELNLY